MTVSRGNVVSRGGKLCDSDVLLMLGVELGHQRILDAAQDHGRGETQPKSGAEIHADESDGGFRC